jgi:hypothetical protein
MSKKVRLFFGAQRGMGESRVCDITNAGARLGLAGRDFYPLNFELSFDNFRTARKCRIVWSRANIAGLAFEN